MVYVARYILTPAQVHYFAGAWIQMQIKLIQALLGVNWFTSCIYFVLFIVICLLSNDLSFVGRSNAFCNTFGHETSALNCMRAVYIHLYLEDAWISLNLLYTRWVFLILRSISMIKCLFDLILTVFFNYNNITFLSLNALTRSLVLLRKSDLGLERKLFQLIWFVDFVNHLVCVSFRIHNRLVWLLAIIDRGTRVCELLI